MKKLLLVLLLFVTTITLSGCVILDELEEDPICINGEVLVGDECVLVEPDPDPEPIDLYSYDVSELPEYITDYLEDSSYTHISEGFETDYDLDGEITEEELEMSYEEMLELFEYDHIVTLTQEDIEDMEWCVDETMDQEYIDAAIYAIEYYDSLPWMANTSWHMESDCSEYRFSFTGTTQFEVFTYLHDGYIEMGYDEDLAIEMAFMDATNVIGYNSLELDIENEEFNTFGNSNISFVIEAMYDMSQNDMNFVALHEITHTFGLDDIYDEEFIGYTLMYGRRAGQDELNPTLRPFDLYNLWYIYGTEEEQE